MSKTQPDPALLAAVPTVPPHVRLTGERAKTFWDRVELAYLGGHSIRALTAKSGRSHGSIQQGLVHRGVAMRVRGGNTRGVRSQHSPRADAEPEGTR